MYNDGLLLYILVMCSSENVHSTQVSGYLRNTENNDNGMDGISGIVLSYLCDYKIIVRSPFGLCTLMHTMLMTVLSPLPVIGAIIIIVPHSCAHNANKSTIIILPSLVMSGSTP